MPSPQSPRAGLGFPATGTADLPALAELIDNDGSISIEPFSDLCVTSASDGNTTLAMLQRFMAERLDQMDDYLKELQAQGERR